MKNLSFILLVLFIASGCRKKENTTGQVNQSEMSNKVNNTVDASTPRVFRAYIDSFSGGYNSDYYGDPTIFQRKDAVMYVFHFAPDSIEFRSGMGVDVFSNFGKRFKVNDSGKYWAFDAEYSDYYYRIILQNDSFLMRGEFGSCLDFSSVIYIGAKKHPSK